MTEFWKKIASVIILLFYTSTSAHHIPGHITEAGILNGHSGPGIPLSLTGEGLKEQHPEKVVQVESKPENLEISKLSGKINPELDLGVQGDLVVPVKPVSLNVNGVQGVPDLLTIRNVPEVSTIEAKDEVAKEKWFSSLFSSPKETTTRPPALSRVPVAIIPSARIPPANIPISPQEYGTTKWTIPQSVSTAGRNPLRKTMRHAPILPFSAPLIRVSPSPRLEQVKRPQQQGYLVVRPLYYSPQHQQLYQPVIVPQSPVLPRPMLLQRPFLPRPGVPIPVKAESNSVKKDKEHVKLAAEKPALEPEAEEVKNADSLVKTPENDITVKDVEKSVGKAEEKRKTVESPARWFFGGWGDFEPDYYYDQYDYEYHYQSPYGNYGYYW